MAKQNNTVIYVPVIDGNERWAMVAAALRAAGISDLRPAPMPTQQFQPRHARPVLLSSAEV